MESIDLLVEALRDEGLELERVGDELTVERLPGGDDVRIDPEPFLDGVSDDERVRRRSIAAFASGIYHALLEPASSGADEWNFTEAAGRLGMAVHAAPFGEGVEAATGSPAWTQPLADDLRYVFFIDLDGGKRVVTVRQFQAWSATPDRIVSGARSMLYHKAQNTPLTSVPDCEHVEELSVDDGYDAARCLILDDLFFGEIDDTSRVALPTTDDLYLVRDGDREAVEELRETVDRRVDEVDYPLTDTLFALEHGVPRPAN